MNSGSRADPHVVLLLFEYDEDWLTSALQTPAVKVKQVQILFAQNERIHKKFLSGIQQEALSVLAAATVKMLNVFTTVYILFMLHNSTDLCGLMYLTLKTCFVG